MVIRKILTRSGIISLNIARQSYFNVVRTNRVNEGNPEIELEDSVRLNSPEDKKRAGAELTQQNDKSQYKKLHGKLMLIEKITSEVNAAAEINAD
ncbi:hypothetical protein Tco_0889689 [Tanacetum coccineum]